VWSYSRWALRVKMSVQQAVEGLWSPSYMLLI
jgi:hypothetical protein